MGQLVNIQEAEYSQLESPRDLTPCPAQCTVLVHEKEAIAVPDTGAGGSVVSARYLAQFDTNWDSNLSRLPDGQWKGYGSKLIPAGVYTTSLTVGHDRGNIRSQMKFVVMEGESLPNYFIIHHDCMDWSG